MSIIFLIFYILLAPVCNTTTSPTTVSKINTTVNATTKSQNNASNSTLKGSTTIIATSGTTITSKLSTCNSMKLCNVSLIMKFSSTNSDFIDMNSKTVQNFVSNFNEYVYNFFKTKKSFKKIYFFFFYKIRSLMLYKIIT